MKKFKKLVASLVAVSSMTLCMTGISANAYNESSDVGSFIWSTSSAKIINTTNTTRYMVAHIDVYRDNTGEFITSDTDNNTGAYNTSAEVKISGYPSSSYNFVCWGQMYNSNVTASSVAWFTGNKYLS